MIDVSQWRASIGLWNYCQAASSRPANGHHSHSFKAAVDSKSGSTTSGEKTSKLPAALSLIALLLLLLFLSLSLLRHILMIPPTGNCYQVQCTTGVTVTDTNYLQSVVLPGGSSSNLIYNDLYLIVCLRMLLLLSGDVELNPGPVTDKKPDLAAVKQIFDSSDNHYLTIGAGLNVKTADLIEMQGTASTKLHLVFQRWFDADRDVNWDTLIKLCDDFPDQLGKAKSDLLKYTGHPMAHSNRADALHANTSLQVRNSSSHICFITNEEGKDICSSLDEIERNFTTLMIRIITAFANCVAEKPDSLSTIKLWLKNSCYITDHISIVAKIDDAPTVEKIFDNIRPLYDSIDCNLIMDMCKLIPEEQELANELGAHHKDAEKFYYSTPIKQLKIDLENLYEPYLGNGLEEMPMMIIKLQNRWSEIKMKGLKRLIGKMLPLDSKQSILRYIEIIPGSVTIHYYALDFTADSLIEYTGGKLQFMHLIGIFSLYINDHPVLPQEDENMNFTFELALLEAVTAGNNEAVEFLLQLETVNIDHTNEEGKTALMLACERGHEDIVHSLLSAGANVDVRSTRELTGVHIMRGNLAESHETGTKQESKKIDPKELLESAAAGKDKSKSDDQKPPVVNEFFPKLEDLESEEKMIKKYSTHLTKEEQQEFIEEVNVILVTATSIEYRAVMGATAPTGGDGKYIKVITKDGSTNFILGKYGRCNVAVIMTEQGPDNTQKVLTSVLDDVKAEYVIAIGICYGAKESKTEELGDKTKLANIIVAKSIVNTEHQRSEEKRNVLPDTYHCGEKLLNLFKHEKVFNFKDKSVKVHVGVLASEFTLHRNEEEKQKILKQVPQALGGEMEANGINRVAVAKKDKFQWIVIKSIVDWGNEDKDKTWQPFGAVSCARFVLKCLKDQPDEGDPLKKQ